MNAFDIHCLLTVQVPSACKCNDKDLSYLTVQHLYDACYSHEIQSHMYVYRLAVSTETLYLSRVVTVSRAQTFVLISTLTAEFRTTRSLMI